MIGRILFIVVAVVSFALDRLTKLLVEAELALGERRDVIDGVLELRHIRNDGIAFGLLAGYGSVIVAGTLVVGALLFFFMLKVEPEDLLTLLGGAFITGGAMGNLVDRVQHQYVVDFLHLPHWPTFNVADIAITLGVALVVLGQIRAAVLESREMRRSQDERT